MTTRPRLKPYRHTTRPAEPRRPDSAVMSQLTLMALRANRLRYGNSGRRYR